VGQVSSPIVTDTSSLLPRLFLWLPLVAIAAHVFEEFVWPGGFAEWYRHYPPGRTAKVSTRFLVIVNIVFVALALVPPLFGATTKGYAYWLVVAAIAGANGLFHLVATVRARKYSPGVVTGVLLYIPLAIVGGCQLIKLSLVAPATALQAVLLAAAYSWWSNWQHSRSLVR